MNTQELLMVMTLNIFPFSGLREALTLYSTKRLSSPLVHKSKIFLVLLDTFWYLHSGIHILFLTLLACTFWYPHSGTHYGTTRSIHDMGFEPLSILSSTLMISLGPFTVLYKTKDLLSLQFSYLSSHSLLTYAYCLTWLWSVGGALWKEQNTTNRQELSKQLFGYDCILFRYSWLGPPFALL